MGEKDSWFRRWTPALLWLPVVVLALVMWSWERKPMYDRSEPLSPIRLVYVQIERSQRDALSGKIQMFADRQHFRSSTKLSSPDPDDIFFYLARDNIQFMGTKNSNTGAPKLQFSLAFYQQRQMPPPSLAEIDPLMTSLKKLLADVPGLVITKEE